MLSLNRYQHTVDGQRVMPLIITGNNVQCVDEWGNVLMKTLEDFSEEKDISVPSAKVIEVEAIEEKSTDVLFDKKTYEDVYYQGELFTEEELGESPKPKQASNERYISDREYI